MKRTFQIIISFFLLFSLSACQPKKLKVLTTSYPVTYLVEKIAGDRVEVHNLSEGSMAQTATLRSDYEELIEGADILFYIQELEPYFELYNEELKNQRKLQVIDLAELSSLYPFQRYTKVYTSGKYVLVEDEYYDSPLFSVVDKYEQDPFLWMDPVAMTSMARTIKDTLAHKMPDDETFFTQNFESLEVELTKLQTAFQKLRDSDQSLNIAVMSPSFGNWQKSFHVGIYPMIISKYGVLPDNEMIDVIRETLMRDGVMYIAREENMPKEYEAVFNKLKKELELQEIKLSNLFSLSEKDQENGYDYIDKMYQNLETLEAILFDEH